MKERYIEIVGKYIDEKELKEIFIKQIENFFEFNKVFELPKHKYKIGDKVFLKKRTFLHGARDSINILDKISETGIISADFTSKYNPNKKTPFCASMWNLQSDMYLRDYIELYSGATLTLRTGDNKQQEIKLVKYGELDKAISEFKDSFYWIWEANQTKESRFMPCLSNNKVDIAFIFNTESENAKEIIKNDIFSSNIEERLVRKFISEGFCDNFLYTERTPLTTDRESAVLFGIPACFIEGILVGENIEKDNDKLNKIKQYFPNAYICNLEGRII